MPEVAEARTSLTLMERICVDAPDPETWDAFVERYGRLIYAWCRRWKLQDSDARDVAQEVLLTLAAKMRSFRYDPGRSFRAWLKTITHHAWQDFLRRRRRPGLGSGDTGARERLETLEARDSLHEVLREAFDREVFDEALRRVERRVDARTWRAFQMQVFEEASGAEAAAALGLSVAAAFMAKSRVKKMLEAEVATLEGTDELGQ